MTVLGLVSDLQYLATKRVLTYSLVLLPSGTLLSHFTVITPHNSPAQHVALHVRVHLQFNIFY